VTSNSGRTPKPRRRPETARGLRLAIHLGVRPERARSPRPEIIAELAAEARKKREGWRWTAHQVGFGSLAKIYYVSEHPDYADLEKHGDAQALFERVLGDKKGQKLLDEVNECLVSNQRTLGVQRPDLSYVKEPAQGVAPLASLSRFRARPGGQHLERIFRSGLEGVDRLEREITVYREDLSNPR